MFTKLANKLFLISSVITLVSLPILLAAPRTAFPTAFLSGDSTAAKLSLDGLMLIVALDVIAQIFLLISMILFTVRDKSQSSFAMICKLLMQLILTSTGSAMIYFTVYRRHYKALQSTHSSNLE